MSDAKTLTCIRCEKEMRNFLADDKGYQPGDGLAFYTHGHYGTTYFDPMDGRSYLEICVCDSCVAEAENLGRVRRVMADRPSPPAA